MVQTPEYIVSLSSSLAASLSLPSTYLLMSFSKMQWRKLTASISFHT
jgi:hypothetical protein